MTNLEYIDAYLNGSPSGQEKLLFEQRVNNDIAFAEEVAFYVSANAAMRLQLQQEKRERFREIYQQQKKAPITLQPVRTLWKLFAAACLVGSIALLTWFMTKNNATPQQMANQYIEQNFTNKTLGVKMGSTDSLQSGLDLYNAGKLNQALLQFESILARDSSNDAAKKYAGVVCLRLKNYDTALYYFKWLESAKGLYSNPGKFYTAITLLSRNGQGDELAAKALLQEVIQNNLDGKEEAVEWLKQMK